MQWTASYRVCVYVPEEVLEDFVGAVGPYIPAFLGNYDHVCWWGEAGVEQSRLMDGGEVQRVSCRRFEFSMPVDKILLDDLTQKVIRPAHPWKEPVITVTSQNIAKWNDLA